MDGRKHNKPEVQKAEEEETLSLNASQEQKGDAQEAHGYHAELI